LTSEQKNAIGNVFDTTDWYQRLSAANGSDASNFARLYTIAGMNHGSGGPSTDQFDMLTPMIAWVEQAAPSPSYLPSAASPPFVRQSATSRRSRH
jgi:feruloyl esterase